MTWREIGPASGGGRVAGVAGSATDPNSIVGAAGGGVWKSANSGQTWSPVFDDQDVAAIGAVTIDPTDNDTVWVGTGEGNPRNDVSYGNGVYKTTDGGDHWTNTGLKETKYITRIAVDPRNHNHVVVAALGDAFSDSPQRGIYVTDDGGKTWKQTLYVGPESGASDLAMNPQNPSVLFAGIWKFQRRPWTFVSGGEEDGIYKSTDGGATWTELAGHGLPASPMGRIGLAVAPSDGNRVYAVIESKAGVLWRSDDGGANWTMVSDNSSVDARPFYFSHLAVDPKNADHVYAVSFQLMLSTNAGKTFKAIAQSVHVDYHAIWIAPNDPSRIMTGEDGGYALTLDGGDNWFFSANLPIGQAYRVGLGNDNPYTVCTGLQDNGAWCGPSNSLDPSGIQNKAWIASSGGDGEWSIPEPDDPNWLWSDSQNGSLTVYNRVTQDQWSAQPYLQTGKESWELATSKYRFNWESPLAFDPWRKNVAWFGGSVVFQTTDRGRSWRTISPDLTRNLKSHQQPAGGPITNDVSSAEYSDTILDIEGSTRTRGEIWVGTDDGLVQLTRDGGKHWANVTPPGRPSTRALRRSLPRRSSRGPHMRSPTDIIPATITRTLRHPRFGKPLELRFERLAVADQWARLIGPTSKIANIVYLGTEEGYYGFRTMAALAWKTFKNDLPTVSVHDIRMQPQFDDLVIATHGRSIYIMDDMTPIQQLATATAAGTYMFPISVSYQYNTREDDEGTLTNYAAPNPPTGAIVDYYLNAEQKTPPTLQIIDSSGAVIRTYKGTHEVEKKQEPYVPNKVGAQSIRVGLVDRRSGQVDRRGEKILPRPRRRTAGAAGPVHRAVDARQQNVYACFIVEARSAHALHAGADRGIVSVRASRRDDVLAG